MAAMNVTLAEMRRLVRDPDVVVLDVLSREAYAAGHLPDAINIPLPEIPARALVELPDRSRTVVVYCGGPTCPMGSQAMSLLEEMGYTRVRHFPGGVQAWRDAGLRVQQGAAAPAARGRPIQIRRDRWAAFIDLFERRTTADLVWIWLATIVAFACVYWGVTIAGPGALIEGGQRIESGRSGFLTALYFSFGAATSVALGDVAPIGALRPLAIAEGVVGLLVFGALVSKILSRRQDRVVGEIHRIAFEDRLERVQTDLHLVLVELQGIARLCREPGATDEAIGARADSASGMCLSELRTIHGLLYRPQEAPEEAMLEGILASLAIVLRELRDVVRDLSVQSRYLTRNLTALSQLADEICADCVPRHYTANLREWMDTIQGVARELR
jgi:rhodanese-related sulfurtransferase